MAETPRGSFPRIRVLVVDERPILRDVVRLACEAHPSLEVVAEAATGEEAIEGCARLRPDVLATDITLPDMDGPELTRRLRRQGSPTHVIVLSTSDDPGALYRSLRAGAEAYLSRSWGVANLALVIEQVASGRSGFTPGQHREAVADFGRFLRQARDTSRLFSLLTARELEILRRLCDGATVQRVASALHVSPKTVEAHITKLYRKLGVRTRVQAVARATGLDLFGLRREAQPGRSAGPAKIA